VAGDEEELALGGNICIFQISSTEKSHNCTFQIMIKRITCVSTQHEPAENDTITSFWVHTGGK
jgi:hypothetical protein